MGNKWGLLTILDAARRLPTFGFGLFTNLYDVGPGEALLAVAAPPNPATSPCSRLNPPYCNSILFSTKNVRRALRHAMPIARHFSGGRRKVRIGSPARDG